MAATSVHCPFCGAPAVAGTREAHYRRGDKVIKLHVQHWECSGDCTSADGQGPYRFEDPQLLRLNDETARRVWLEQFDEPMPAAGRPGRKVNEKRGNRVSVLLSDTEVARLDALRGEESRSEFLRRTLAPSNVKAPGFPLYELPLTHRRRRSWNVLDSASGHQ